MSDHNLQDEAMGMPSIATEQREESQLEKRLNIHNKKIHGLDALVSELKGKLKPVMTPMSQGKEPSNGDKLPPQSGSPIVQIIDRHSRLVDNLIATVHDMIVRTEV